MSMPLNHTPKLFQKQLNFVPIEVLDIYGHHTVQAIIFDKLAVHDLQGDQPVKGSTVTHLATGYSLVSFKSFNVACKFAIDIQGRFNIDGMVKQALAGKQTPELQAEVDKLALRALHDSYLFTQHAKDRLERIAPQWLAKHLNNEIVGYKAAVVRS